jgi:DNA-binding MarR family transcriptional regulator
MVRERPDDGNNEITMARDIPRDAPTARLEKSPIHLLHRAGQCAGDIFQTEMGGGDLTPRQYAVLLTVSLNEGLSQTHLVEKTGIDRSTLADIVRRMLKKGLLQRRRTKEDARAYAVRLTDEGWKALRAADPVAKRVDERILTVLPGQQRERFMQDLNAIVEALGGIEAQDKMIK